MARLIVPHRCAPACRLRHRWLRITASLLLGAGLLLALSGIDAARASSNSAPPPPPPPAAYDWTGPYIGINAGGGFGDGTINDKDCHFCADDSFHKAFGEAGGQAGYNWQFGSALLGVEGDMNWASLDRKGFIGLDNRNSGKDGLKLDAFASLRARAGLTAGRTLFYLTAGPALGHVNGFVNSYTDTTFATQTASWKAEGWDWGIAAGPGLEVALGNNWSLKGEYLFLDFADKTANMEPSSACDNGGGNCRVGFPLRAQVARLGLNYKFAGFAEPRSPDANEVTFVADWSGPYIGANAGGGFGDGAVEDKDCGFFCNNDDFHKGFAETGGQIGYNWQFDSTVIGIEGDLNWANLDHEGFGDSSPGKDSLKLDAFASLRARAGLAVGRSLFYLTAGPALGHVNGSMKVYSDYTFTTQTASWKSNGWDWGMAAGPGLEYLLGPNLSLKAEYLFLDFADKTEDINPQSACGVGERCRLGFPLTAQVARLGLNYKFDGWKPPSFVSGNAFSPKTSPVHNWSGFYVGVNGGGGMGDGEIQDKDCLFCASDSFHKAFAEAGGQAGYNWQFGSAVLGVEGDLNWSSLDHQGFIGLSDSGEQGKDGLKLDAFASLRARAGLAAGRSLFYLTAGPALGHVNGFANSYTDITFTTQTASWKETGLDWGMAAGPGLEVALDNNWSIKGEYLFLDFADKTTNIQPQSACPQGGGNCRIGFPLTAQVARVGLNYKFE